MRTPQTEPDPTSGTTPSANRAATDFWSLPAASVAAGLGVGLDGLTSAAAHEKNARAAKGRGSHTGKRDRPSLLPLFGRQLADPLVLILVVASAVSMLAAEWVDASVVLAIVAVSTVLGVAQEWSAGNAVAALRARLTHNAIVLRDGAPRTVPSIAVVPGDILLLSAGALIPVDGRVLEARDFFVNEAMLTGETLAVEKRPDIVDPTASLGERRNCVFAGTNVSSGTARVLVTQTGEATVYGQIADQLALRPPLTAFERGIKRFGYLLTRIMLVMVLIVLTINVFSSKPPVSSLMFALALAVGLTPELLPAIISITLSHGARRMAGLGVIVRRLPAIENLGSMDVLCTDKTGTLTEGVVQLDGAHDLEGRPCASVMRLASANAYCQTGLVNPLDAAIVSAAAAQGISSGSLRKIDEIPYDFIRKRLSVVIDDHDGPLLICKGALDSVLAVCARARIGALDAELDPTVRADIEARFDRWSSAGFRVLGVASRRVAQRAEPFTTADEDGLCFEGFLLFRDPLRKDARQVIAALAARGVAIRIVTGDNRKVAAQIAGEVGLPLTGALTGRELQQIGDEALMQTVRATTVFSELDPNQKARIIRALQQTGHVVGYMGDGINDALALHAADVGISVENAVDVAREAADFVLLRKDLDLLREGIDEGRRTFANTLKYVLTTISANFGNMFSMAVASLFLPFLPLLASQILLNNLLSDIPAAAIASDRVDPEWVATPRRWDTDFIRDYMIQFGLLSSLFDMATFGILIWIFEANAETFRTGWFVESLLTELVVALVVRTRMPFWRSRPGTLLLTSTIVVALIALALPWLPVSALLGLVPMPAPLLLTVLGLTAAYAGSVEFAKRGILRRLGNGRV